MSDCNFSQPAMCLWVELTVYDCCFERMMIFVDLDEYSARDDEQTRLDVTKPNITEFVIFHGIYV